MKFCWVKHQKRTGSQYLEGHIIYHQGLSKTKPKDKLIKLIHKTILENDKPKVNCQNILLK